MRKIFLLFVLFNLGFVFAIEKHELVCVAGEYENGFSANIELKQTNNSWEGKISNYRESGKIEPPGECTAPSFIGLSIGGQLDQKFYYHESEYEPGCILRIVFLSLDDVRAWVYLKEDYGKRSNQLRAKCEGK